MFSFRYTPALNVQNTERAGQPRETADFGSVLKSEVIS